MQNNSNNHKCCCCPEEWVFEDFEDKGFSKNNNCNGNQNTNHFENQDYGYENFGYRKQNNGCECNHHRQNEYNKCNCNSKNNNSSNRQNRCNCCFCNIFRCFRCW